MPKNDPDHYHRIYAKLLGSELVTKHKRERKHETNVHPLWYFRRFGYKDLFAYLMRVFRQLEQSAGRAESAQGKIPLAIITGASPRGRNFVIMRLEDFIDLNVGERAGEHERENDRMPYNEWALGGMIGNNPGVLWRDGE